MEDSELHCSLEKSPKFRNRIKSFRDLSKCYDVIFLDSDGVLRDSGGPFPNVKKVLQLLLDERKQIFLITNSSSVSPARLASRIVGDDFQHILGERQVISAGMIASQYLQSNLMGGTILALGHAESFGYVTNAGCKIIDLQDYDESKRTRFDAFIILTSFGFDVEQSLEKAKRLLSDTDVPLLCPNSDDIVPLSGNQTGHGPFALAKSLSISLKREFCTFGKPASIMFETAFRNAQLLNPNLLKSSVVMVGDNLTTDIRGANQFGIDSILLLTGVTSTEDLKSESRKQNGPTFICNSIFT